MRLIVELQKCGEIIALDFPAFFNVRHIYQRRRAAKRLAYGFTPSKNSPKLTS